MYKICHTEESSRRQRELEAGLLKAMGAQPYDRITLTELCRQLQIPRKTFYRYFPTKDDCLLALIDHTLSDCNTVSLMGWEGGKDLTQRHLVEFFDYWLRQKCFLDAIQTNRLRYLLLDRTTVIVDKMAKPTVPEGFARDQVAYFIAHGLMTTVLRWHHHSFPCPPEEMAEAFSHILCSPDISITRLLL